MVVLWRLFQPLLVKDDFLVGKYEILFGDEDDRVLACFRRIGRSGIEILIALNAPGAVGDVWFHRYHRPSAVGLVEVIVPR